MLGLLAGVFALALVDSINPSAFAVTIYLLLATRRPTSRVLAYVTGIFVAYFTVGLLLVLGLDVLKAKFSGYLDGPVAYGIQGVVGAVLLYYSFYPPGGKNKKPKDRTPRSLNHVAIFGLGLLISLVEFSTTFPYLGAIGMISTSGLPMVQWLPVLVIYNLIMIVPPLLMLVAYKLMGERIRGRLERMRDKIREGSRDTMLWIIGIVGFFLLANCLYHFKFFGMIDVPDEGGIRFGGVQVPVGAVLAVLGG